MRKEIALWWEQAQEDLDAARFNATDDIPARLYDPETLGEYIAQTTEVLPSTPDEFERKKGEIGIVAIAAREGAEIEP